MYEDKYIPLRKVCELVGFRPNTVREWAKQGKIKSVITPTGQRIYPSSQFENFNDLLPVSKEGKKIIYCRVSSKEKSDDLERQVKYLRSKYPDHELIKDCGSGINWKRKGLKTILEYAMSGNLCELVVAHRDRLCRFAFELIEWIITANDGQIIVLDADEHKTPEQELADDLLSITQIFTCKSIPQRRYKTENLKDTSVS